MDPDDLAAALRTWAAEQLTAPEQAAVELLIWKGWLNRVDFQQAVIEDIPGFGPTIQWGRVEAFGEKITNGRARASGSEAVILDLALGLVDDRFHLASLGHAHKRAVAAAFATACGQVLEPETPRHSHPDFIPGDPAACPRCALEANAVDTTEGDTR